MPAPEGGKGSLGVLRAVVVGAQASAASVATSTPDVEAAAMTMLVNRQALDCRVGNRRGALPPSCYPTGRTAMRTPFPPP